MNDLAALIAAREAPSARRGRKRKRAAQALWFIPHDIGSTAAIADFLISVAGFAVTICAALGAKSAAEQARTAEREARERVLQFDTVVDFSAAVTTLDEIRRLQREKARPVLLDRYSAISKLVIQIRHSGTALTDVQHTIIQRVLTHIRELENQVERALAINAELKTSRLNLMVSEQLAIELGQRPAALAEVGAKLAAGLGSSSLVDIRQFTRDLESAFYTMWQRSVSCCAPGSFAVPAA
jgi:hypothetical protein